MTVRQPVRVSRRLPTTPPAPTRLFGQKSLAAWRAEWKAKAKNPPAPAPAVTTRQG